jgi:hypothetical protein
LGGIKQANSSLKMILGWFSVIACSTWTLVIATLKAIKTRCDEVKTKPVKYRKLPKIDQHIDINELIKHIFFFMFFVLAINW